MDAPNPVAFVRAALVDSGVLEPRDEYSAKFAAWHAQAVLQISPGRDRAQVAAYATWHVAHQLARIVQRRGEVSYASLKYARSLVTEAIKLVNWLHEQQLELADLRQDLVDEWVTAGGTTRRRVRLFLAWLERASVIAPLEVGWDDRVPTRPALDDDRRFAILRRLLHDRESISATGSSAACCSSTASRSPRSPRCGPLPSMSMPTGRRRFGSAAERSRCPSRSMRSRSRCETGSRERTGTNAWLLPGRHAGTHITADTLRGRLKRYGIGPSREGRHAALLALAARLPAPILAERIGIHQARAAQWVRLAGSGYADYVALRIPARHLAAPEAGT